MDPEEGEEEEQRMRPVAVRRQAVSSSVEKKKNEKYLMPPGTGSSKSRTPKNSRRLARKNSKDKKGTLKRRLEGRKSWAK